MMASRYVRGCPRRSMCARTTLAENHRFVGKPSQVGDHEKISSSREFYLSPSLALSLFLSFLMFSCLAFFNSHKRKKTRTVNSLDRCLETRHSNGLLYVVCDVGRRRTKTTSRTIQGNSVGSGCEWLMTNTGKKQSYRGAFAAELHLRTLRRQPRSRTSPLAAPSTSWRGQTSQKPKVPIPCIPAG